ncbi:hypothetical protein JL721_8604 [Aureococcus anophagefferens]|nr:hypothetical protein JL721_8604 [Aureococcus anophagefferens]
MASFEEDDDLQEESDDYSYESGEDDNASDSEAETSPPQQPYPVSLSEEDVASEARRRATAVQRALGCSAFAARVALRLGRWQHAAAVRDAAPDAAPRTQNSAPSAMATASRSSPTSAAATASAATAGAASSPWRRASTPAARPRLRWSYCFAYYERDDDKRRLFAFAQKQLETFTASSAA